MKVTSGIVTLLHIKLDRISCEFLAEFKMGIGMGRAMCLDTETFFVIKVFPVL